MNTAKAVLLGIVGLFVAVVLAIGIWKLDWFVQEKNTDRQVHIDNRNTGTQTAWHDEVVKTMADYAVIDENNTAARGALKNKACNLIPRLRSDYRTDDIEEFYQENC